MTRLRTHSWLRSAAGPTTQRACGSNTQRSAKPPSARRPQLACSVPKAAPSTAAGALVTLASARIAPGPPGAWPHFSASGSSSSSPLAPGSASANGNCLASAVTGVWSDTSASMMPSASAAASASRSRDWRSGGLRRAALS